MAISHIHSYLVHPGKGVDPKERQAIRGTKVTLSGNLYALLEKIDSRADEECKLDVAFQSDNKQNDCRDLVTSYAERPTLKKGRTIAERLQEHTDGKSKMGLLFLVRGANKAKYRLLISRFPADVGILAEEERGKLTVEFLEKVFMKNAFAYKAALYEGKSLTAGFWDGKVVDRQIQGGVIRSASDYWVKGFLDSDCKTTSAYGTRRFARLLKDTIKDTDDQEIKAELVSAARLAKNLSGKTVSVESVVEELKSTGGSGCVFFGLFADHGCDVEVPEATLKCLGDLGFALRFDYYEARTETHA